MQKQYPQLKFLKYLLYLSSLPSDKISSTATLSKEFDVSQQTISRVLREMEDLSLITRTLSSSGQSLVLTQKGRDVLLETKSLIDSALEEKFEKVSINGIVCSGSGEGAYYMSQRGYMDQFKNILNCVPFPGTLNVLLSPSDVKKKVIISGFDPVFISGFRTREREFGVLLCYPCLIGGSVDGFVIFPERVHHEPNILEVISDANLKDTLALKDGDKLRVVVW
ncbi:CTP-dependent riboflavin kinase [archaeon]|nr:CTP-dependent riboflavin kinase [archaeon]